VVQALLLVQTVQTVLHLVGTALLLQVVVAVEVDTLHVLEQAAKAVQAAHLVTIKVAVVAEQAVGEAIPQPIRTIIIDRV
jgi:hypothetical protein